MIVCFLVLYRRISQQSIVIVICLHCLRDAFTMRCAILELEANLETFPAWFIFGGRLPQTRGVFSTVLLKSVAVCLYAARAQCPIIQVWPSGRSTLIGDVTPGQETRAGNFCFLPRPSNSMCIRGHNFLTQIFLTGSCYTKNIPACRNMNVWICKKSISSDSSRKMYTYR